MESITDQAHKHATEGEDFEKEKKFSKAIASFRMAADKYLQASSDSSDPQTQGVLKKLSIDYLKKAKSLENRMLAAEQLPAQNSPSPQSKAPQSRTTTTSSPILTPSPIDTQRNLSPSTKQAAPQSFAVQEEEREAEPPEFLGGFQEEDEGVSFQRFMEIVQQLVQKLPAGMAFALAPNRIPAGKEPEKRVPSQDPALLESFYLVPENEEDSNKRLIEELKRENAMLREQNEALKKKEEIERVVKENELLRSSIIHFKQEVETQFRKYQPPATGLRSLTLPHAIKHDLNVSYQSKPQVSDVVEKCQRLEEENLKLKKEVFELNTKIRAYKERWAKLKESAKKHQSESEKSLESLSQMGQTSDPPSVFYSTSDGLTPEKDVGKKEK